MSNTETELKSEVKCDVAGSGNNHDTGDNVELHHDDPTPFADEVEFPSKEDNSPTDRIGKRHRDDHDDGNDKRDSVAAPKRPRNTRGDDKVELRLLIPVNTAGALIGKGGSNIRELRSEFSANIQIPDSSGYERVVTAVTSNMEDLANFVGKAARCLNERMRPREECSIRLLIHKSQAGTIIGIKGTRIKELRETTGAKIKVNQECCPNSTDRICQITGSNEILIKCVQNVLELLATAPPKGHVQNYDPSYYDDSYNYGGFNGFDSECPFDHSLRRRNRDAGFDSMPPFRNRGGRGGGRFDDDFDDDYSRRRMGGVGSGGLGGRSGMRYPPDRPMRRGPRLSGPAGLMGKRPSRLSFDCDDDGGYGDFEETFPTTRPEGGKIGGLMDNPIGDGGKRESTQVTIPTALAGSIIGVRGSRIRQIRQDSGANIKIEEELPGTKERIITIIGNAEQIQNAQYLLQKSVKLYSGERF